MSRRDGPHHARPGGGPDHQHADASEGRPEWPAAPLRVSILNDYEVVVVGLRALLAKFPERVVVVEGSAGGSVRQRVDVALVDTFAADHAGLTPRALRARCNARVIAVYSWTPAASHDRLPEGQVVWISKRLDAEGLVLALEAAAAHPHRDGHPVRDHPRREGSGRTGERAGVRDWELGDWPGREAGLSRREAEILARIVQGQSNEDIAHGIYLSLNTIKSYIRSAYRKMGVASRSQAILWGIDNGFVPGSPARVHHWAD